MKSTCEPHTGFGSKQDEVWYHVFFFWVGCNIPPRCAGENLPFEMEPLWPSLGVWKFNDQYIPHSLISMVWELEKLRKVIWSLSLNPRCFLLVNIILDLFPSICFSLRSLCPLCFFLSCFRTSYFPHVLYSSFFTCRSFHILYFLILFFVITRVVSVTAFLLGLFTQC